MHTGRLFRLGSILAAAVLAWIAHPAEPFSNERVPVGGSWTRDCVNAEMSGTLLTASCPGAGKAMTTSTLDIATCNPPAQAANQNGRLACETGVRISAPAETSPASQLATTETPPMQAPLTGIAARPYAGEWDIVTERGDRFRLTAEQTGNAVTGSVPFGEQRLQMNGVVGAEKKLTLVWQLGNIAGTGELSLSEDGKKLQGLLQSEGGPIDGGTWTGTRPGSGPVALPLGEAARTAALPQATAPAGNAAATPAGPPDGFQTATVTSAVSIRDKPSSRAGESRVIGTLPAGRTVPVRCVNRFWCELSEGGFVSASFLRLGDAAGPSSGSASASTTMTAGPAAIFAGNWNVTLGVIGSPISSSVPMTIVQTGNSAEIRTEDGNFPGTVNGRVLNASVTKNGDHFGIRLTLDGSGNRFDGTVSENGKQAHFWTGTRTGQGGTASSVPAQRLIAPSVGVDESRFPLEMFEGLFRKRVTD